MDRLSLAPLLILLFVAFTAAPGLAQNPDGQQLFTASREQLDVTKIVLAQERAWDAGDLPTYISLFKDAPDTEAMINNLPVRGYPNIRTAYTTAFSARDRMGQLEQSEVEVRELGPDHALASGRYHLSRGRKFGGDTDGVFWEIFEKTGGRWQIVFSMTS